MALRPADNGTGHMERRRGGVHARNDVAFLEGVVDKCTTPSRKATSSSEIFPVSPAAPCSSLASSAPRANSRPWMR